MKFISWNIPNLHFIEDPYFHRATPWEQDDALRCLSNSPIRIYTLSLRKPSDPIYYNGKNLITRPNGTITTDASWQRHLYGPGLWDVELLSDLENAFKTAQQYNVTIIMPVIDEWNWWGGYETMASWRGLPKDEFWTNSQLIQDYKDIVTTLLTKFSKYSIIWETGNELGITRTTPLPSSWTLTMAQHFKSLSNQMVIDGSTPMKWKWSEQVLSSQYIDGFTQHYYESLGRPIPSGYYAGLVIGLLLLAVSLGLFFYFRKRHTPTKQEDEDTIISPVEENSIHTVSPLPPMESPTCMDKLKVYPKSLLGTILGMIIGSILFITFLSLILAYLFTPTTTLLAEDASIISKYPNKLFYVGEVGLMSSDQAKSILSAILSNPTVTGALYWSLRFHTNNTGFYTHLEKSPWASHHYPGLSPANPSLGYPTDDLDIVTIVREYTAKANGLSEMPILSKPFPPSGVHLNPTDIGVEIYWRGGCPARYYTLQRCNTTCITLNNRVMETVGWQQPNYIDTGVSPGVYYKIRGENEGGNSEWAISEILQ